MTLDANEHRIIIAALETYQSMWAVAVSEARQADMDPTDRRRDEELAQGRYDEAGELLAKFKADPEGASTVECIDKLAANIAAEQARDRDRVRGVDALGREGKTLDASALDTLERLHNLDDLR